MVAGAFLAALPAGCGSNDEEPPEAVESAAYHAYLDEHAGELVRAIQAMLPELEDGEAGRAQSRYVRARVRYSQVEPASEAFPALDARINGGSEGGEAQRGFHRIEKPLFASESTAGTPSFARRLIADTKELQRRLVRKSFSAQELAASSARILGEISAVKLADEEQPYADADLVDVSANLEAVGAAFDALRPALKEDERAEIRARLKKAYAVVGQYGTPARNPDQPRDLSPGVLFVVFGELSPAETEELRRPVEDLRGSFEDLQARLGDG